MAHEASVDVHNEQWEEGLLNPTVPHLHTMAPSSTTPPIYTLPPELILMIASELVQSLPPHHIPAPHHIRWAEKTGPSGLSCINSLTQSSRRLHETLNPFLWSLMDLDSTLLWASVNENWDLVMYALSRGGNPNFPKAAKYRKYHYEPLSLDYASAACNVPIMIALLDSGANVSPTCDTYSHQGGTLLQGALASWRTADQPGHDFAGAVKLLIDRGADTQWAITATRGYDQPCSNASVETREAVDRFIQLLMWKDLSATLQWATENWKWDIAAEAIARGANPQDYHPDPMHHATALHYAAHGGHVPTMRLLLGAGASCDASDMVGRKPIVWAVGALREMNKTEQKALPEQDHVGAVKFLIQYGSPGWGWGLSPFREFPANKEEWSIEMRSVEEIFKSAWGKVY